MLFTLAVLMSMLIAMSINMLPGTSAYGFGTVNSFGQKTEHERITRAALACSGASSSTCFEPRSIDNLAGKGGTFGAVGSPDSDEVFNSAAHCDDADYLAVKGYGGYKTPADARAAATAQLGNCVTHLRMRFQQAVRAASGLLDDKGRIKPAEVKLDSTCTFFGGASGRAKCDVLEGLGRAMHGTEDFYSHSNWADAAAPGKVDTSNPPGLGMTTVAPFLNLRSGSLAGVPTDLATGCFSLLPWGCRKRITHGDLNKDTGTIDPATGAASSPTTSRGRVGANFSSAVGGAVAEARRQWSDLSAELVSTYGATRGNLMVCALTRDDPIKDCTGRRIVIVIDSSGSNTDTDPSNLRIAAGQSLNEQLISADEAGPDEKPDQSAVVDFDTSARLVSPMADPSQASFAGIDSSGGTDIGAGVSTAIAELTKDPAQPVKDRAGIVVLTDGLDGGSSLPGALAQAASLGIRVNFGFLSPPEVPVPARQSPRTKADLGRPLSRKDFTPDTALIAGIAATGGVYSVITGAAAQQDFVTLVTNNGLANLDDPNGVAPGGLLQPNVSSSAVLPASGRASYEFATRPGRALTVSLRALDGQGLQVATQDILTGQTLGTVTSIPGATDPASVTVHPRSGKLAVDVVSEAAGAYELSVAPTGTDLIGTGSVDRLVCLPTPTYADGGAGDDTITCGALEDTVVGGPGKDRVDGGAGDDLFVVARGDLAQGEGKARGTERIFGGEGTDTVVFLFPQPDPVRCRKGNVGRVDLGKHRMILKEVERVEFNYVPCSRFAAPTVAVPSLTSNSGSDKQSLRPPKPRLKSARVTGKQVKVLLEVSKATVVGASGVVVVRGKRFDLGTAYATPSRAGKVTLLLTIPAKAVKMLRPDRRRRRHHGLVVVEAVTAGVLGGPTKKARLKVRY